MDQAEAKFTPPGIKQHEYHDHAGNTIEVYLVSFASRCHAGSMNSLSKDSVFAGETGVEALT